MVRKDSQWIKGSSYASCPWVYQHFDRYGHAEIVKFLAKTMENPNISMPNNGLTPLKLAAQNNHSETVKILINIMYEKNIFSDIMDAMK